MPLTIVYFFIYIPLVICIMIFINNWSLHYFGNTVGTIVSLLLIVVFFVFLLSSCGFKQLLILIDTAIPISPRCELKKCSFKDFTITIYGSRQTNDEYSIWKCKCGNVYKMKGDKFYKLESKDKEINFLKYSHISGWIKNDCVLVQEVSSAVLAHEVPSDTNPQFSDAISAESSEVEQIDTTKSVDNLDEKR